MVTREANPHWLPRQLDAIGMRTRSRVHRLAAWCTALCLALAGVVQASPAADKGATVRHAEEPKSMKAMYPK